MVSTIDSLYFYCAMMREHHHHFNGNGAVKREQRELVPNFLRLFGSKRHPSGCRAAKREHHRHFSGKDTNYRAQCQIYHDLFLTTEGGREQCQLSGND